MKYEKGSGMSRYIITAVLLFSFSAAIGQHTVVAAGTQNVPVQMVDSVRNYLDSTFSILEKKALNKDKVDWHLLKKTVYGKAAGAKTYEDILPLYPYIFEQITDHHGRLNFKNKSYGWDGNDTIVKNKVVLAAIAKFKEPYSTIIEKHTGYILIPGNNDFQSKGIDSITTSIKKAIAKVNGKAIKGWIIDLRNNTGGNMYPMLAGLSKLIGDGKAGSFVTVDGKTTGSWSIKDGYLYYESIKVSPVQDEGYAIPANLPIVVLVGGYTASSGEMTAISTIGRKKAVLIGEQTAGYTTVNTGFRLNAYSGMNLAVEYAADRNLTLYPKNVTPDIVVIGGDDFEDLTQDKKVQKALSWLKKNRYTSSY